MASVFKNSVRAAIGNTPVVCYTAPASTATTVIGLSAANTHSSSVYLDITLTDTSAGTTVYLGKQLLVPVRGTIVVVGGEQKLVLETGDYISITSSVSSSVDAVVSVLEVS